MKKIIAAFFILVTLFFGCNSKELKKESEPYKENTIYWNNSSELKDSVVLKFINDVIDSTANQNYEGYILKRWGNQDTSFYRMSRLSNNREFWGGYQITGYMIVKKKEIFIADDNFDFIIKNDSSSEIQKLYEAKKKRVRRDNKSFFCWLLIVPHWYGKIYIEKDSYKRNRYENPRLPLAKEYL